MPARPIVAPRPGSKFDTRDESAFRRMVEDTVRDVLADVQFNTQVIGFKDPNAFNVKAFGAVGDGTTNDTAALQAAIDAAQNVDGQVLIPFGEYTHTGLTVTGDIRILGVPTFRPTTGRSARLECTTAAPNIHVDLSTSGAQVEVGHLTLIDGSEGVLVSGDFSLLRGSYFHDLIIDGSTNAGIFLDGVTDGSWEGISSVWENIFIDGLFGQPDYGIRIVAQPNFAIVTGSLWKNIRISNTDLWAISLDAAGSSFRDFGTWEGLILEHNDGGGVQIRSGSVDIRGAHFEGNGATLDRPDIQLEHGDNVTPVDSRLILGTVKFNTGGASQTDRLLTVDDSAIVVIGYDGPPIANWDFASTSTFLAAHWTRRLPSLLNASNLRGYDIDAAVGDIVLRGGIQATEPVRAPVPHVTVNSSTTLTEATHAYRRVRQSSGSTTITLPATSAVLVGTWFIVSKINAGTVNLALDAGDTGFRVFGGAGAGSNTANDLVIPDGGYVTAYNFGSGFWDAFVSENVTIAP